MDQITPVPETTKNLNLEEHKATVLFDVTALFTSFDMDLLKKIAKTMQEHHPGKPLEAETIYALSEMCLCMCFKFNSDLRD